MYGLADIGARLNMGNLYHHQSVADHHPNLVSKLAHLKDMEDMDPFIISGVDGGKESEQGKGGLDLTTVFTYKNTFVVNGKPVIVYLVLG